MEMAKVRHLSDDCRLDDGPVPRHRGEQRGERIVRRREQQAPFGVFLKHHEAIRARLVPGFDCTQMRDENGQLELTGRKYLGVDKWIAVQQARAVAADPCRSIGFNVN